MPENEKVERCLIWTDSPANVDYSPVGDRRGGFYLRWKVDSPRAGGLYSVKDDPPLPAVELRGLDEDARARLTTLLVDLRDRNDEAYVPDVTPELIEQARRARPLDVDVRAERLLRFIGNQSKSIGDVVTLDSTAPTTDIYMQAMAWSESTSENELGYLLDYLSEGQHWTDRSPTGTRYDGYLVTVDGYRRLAEVKANHDSAQAFVAMWFDDEMNDAYSNGIEPAIRDAGYRPVRIDQKPDVTKIDDAIIAEIRRSRFLVADFTHGKDGARGGVYFEAGFAFGLNIPVIHTCREDAIDQIHFDTRQYHHTAWSRPEELRRDLKNRILALIGEGPVRSDTGP